jgi:hypothetical protein
MTLRYNVFGGNIFDCFQKCDMKHTSMKKKVISSLKREKGRVLRDVLFTNSEVLDCSSVFCCA